MAYIPFEKLDRRIEIQEKIDGKDAHFQPTVTYRKVHECWASFQDQYLRDMVATVGTTLENTVTFVIRYDQKVEVTRSHFIYFEGKRYNIIRVNKGQYNRDYTTIVAKEV